MTKNETDKLLIQQCLDERWYPVINGDIAFNDTKCALCEKYDDNHFNCDACPIFFTTGKRNCRGTPFGAWARCVREGSLHIVIKQPCAQEMITFLEDVRDSL